MNQDEILRWAAEADAYADDATESLGEFHPHWHEVRDARFAALVRAQVIEEAAQTVEAMVHGNVRTCAAAIRGMKSDSGHSAAADAGASTAPLPEGDAHE